VRSAPGVLVARPPLEVVRSERSVAVHHLPGGGERLGHVNASIIYRTNTPLTARQEAALTWLRTFAARHGAAPSQRELANGLGVHRKTALKILSALKRKKRISFGGAGAHRSIRILEEQAPPLLSPAERTELGEILEELPPLPWRRTGGGAGVGLEAAAPSFVGVSTRGRRRDHHHRTAVVRFLLMMRDIAPRLLVAAATSPNGAP